jgi:hypothetical protein
VPPFFCRWRILTRGWSGWSGGGRSLRRIRGSLRGRGCSLTLRARSIGRLVRKPWRGVVLRRQQRRCRGYAENADEKDCGQSHTQVPSGPLPTQQDFTPLSAHCGQRHRDSCLWKFIHQPDVL